MIFRTFMLTGIVALLAAGSAGAETRNECVHEGQPFRKDCRVCMASRGYGASGQLYRCTETRSGNNYVLKWQNITGARCDPRLTKPTC